MGEVSSVVHAIQSRACLLPLDHCTLHHSYAIGAHDVPEVTALPRRASVKFATAGVDSIVVQVNPGLRHHQESSVAPYFAKDWIIVEITSPSANFGTHEAAPATPAEPDYRFTLANERTFLAWQRTALGLLAAAVGVVQFLPELAIPGLRHILGGAIAVVAVLTSVAGLHRWSQVDQAIRRNLPLPRPATPIYLAVALIVVGLLTVTLSLATTTAGR